jgi:carbon-monoxide dehydrogenase small subunit
LKISIAVNGEVLSPEVSAGETLLELLRRLGLKGAKQACETGNCGACTVLLDGRPVASCIMLAAQADGRSVRTVEGLSEGGRLHAVQEAFMDAGAPQCGFCTPGMIMTAVAFLDENPEPTRAEVRTAIAGNICRCSGYVKVVDAIMDAAERLKRASESGRESGTRKDATDE